MFRSSVPLPSSASALPLVDLVKSLNLSEPVTFPNENSFMAGSLLVDREPTEFVVSFAFAVFISFHLFLSLMKNTFVSL